MLGKKEETRDVSQKDCVVLARLTRIFVHQVRAFLIVSFFSLLGRRISRARLRFYDAHDSISAGVSCGISRHSLYLKFIEKILPPRQIVHALSSSFVSQRMKIAKDHEGKNFYSMTIPVSLFTLMRSATMHLTQTFFIHFGARYTCFVALVSAAIPISRNRVIYLSHPLCMHTEGVEDKVVGNVIAYLRARLTMNVAFLAFHAHMSH